MRPMHCKYFLEQKLMSTLAVLFAFAVPMWHWHCHTGFGNYMICFTDALNLPLYACRNEVWECPEQLHCATRKSMCQDGQKLCSMDNEQAQSNCRQYLHP